MDYIRAFDSVGDIISWAHQSVWCRPVTSPKPSVCNTVSPQTPTNVQYCVRQRRSKWTPSICDGPLTGEYRSSWRGIWCLFTEISSLGIKMPLDVVKGLCEFCNFMEALCFVVGAIRQWDMCMASGGVVSRCYMAVGRDLTIVLFPWFTTIYPMMIWYWGVQWQRKWPVHV